MLPSPVDYIRSRFFNHDIDFNFACGMIKCRRDTPSYCFFDIPDDKGGVYTVKSKTPFRGNDVYRARVWNRHKELLTFCECNNNISYVLHDDHGYTSNILKFTLTVDPSGWDRDEFDSYYGQYFYDLFIKRIRNDFPGVVVAKSVEVSTKKARGYLHYNVVAVFPDHAFPVYLHTSKRCDSKGRPIKSWRLKEYSMKRDFDDLWDPGYVDVRSVKGPGDLAEYTLKYHIKDFTNPKNRASQNLTLSTLSLYNKRSFSFPRASIVRGTLDFCETVINYTVGLDLEGPVLFPRLDIINHNSLDCDFLGHFVDYQHEYDSDLWYEVVDRPPDSLDPVKLYQDCFAPSVVLVNHDYGSRLNPVTGFYENKEFKLPKYTFQKKFRKTYEDD